MFVTTEGVHEPHFVIGPVFALSEIRSGFLSNLDRPGAAFESLLPILEMEATKRKAHCVIGARFAFVDSNLTSTLGIMLGLKSQAVYVFGSGTAVQLHRYLQSPDEIERDFAYRLSLAPSPRERAQVSPDDPTQGLKRMIYANFEYWVHADGRVRARTPKGWVDFASLAELKNYKGVK